MTPLAMMGENSGEQGFLYLGDIPCGVHRLHKEKLLAVDGFGTIVLLGIAGG